ncbi:MAG: DUF2325 domain-containing protein [Pseudomonadota bacterium]
MCDKQQADRAAPATACQTVPAQSSRRRRIWELSHACHCPLVGVGLPLGALRKLIGKRTGGTVQASDYEVHVGAVSECAARNGLSEAIQKDLERRYVGVVQRFRAAKDGARVSQLWREAMAKGDVAGAFWAALTHPRCDAEMEEQLCRDLHMIQHQAGACVRADLGKFNALVEENARLGAELARLQQRTHTLLLEKNADKARHDAQAMQARATAIGKDSVIDALQMELAELQASIPGLASRATLVQRLGQMEERERAWRQQLAELRQAGPRQAGPREAGRETPTLVGATTPPAPARTMKMPIRLVDQSVLCVGGRSGNVATYRALIERVGAQFAHHDGGLEDNVGLLDSSLAAADVVICQTGCISHSAYWRVKDHCKRHGKRCVFIDNPSISSLARGLQEMSGAEAPA